MIGQKDSEIDIYKAKIGDLKGQFSENQNQELATARADCQKWHSKVKELSRRELELLETIENLKQEQKKQLAQYILNKKKVAANASTAGGVNISSAYEGTDGDKTRDQLLKLDRDKGALSQKVTCFEEYFCMELQSSFCFACFPRNPTGQQSGT
mmetsp:Transcript_52464/g.59985  ORF Transcript_52464/g.59985 Transcript_52464/m.59985 type:complete len:154 (+) Transcript_52464:1502-1963(+)